MAVHSSPAPIDRSHRQPTLHSYVLRCRRCGIVIGFGDRCDFCVDRPSDHVDAPGEYQGRHHSEWIPTVEALIDDDSLDAAELLLWRLIDATEAEARATGAQPLDRHFRRLERLVRLRGDDALGDQVKRRYDDWREAASGTQGTARS
jgi:hypothetical protein